MIRRNVFLGAMFISAGVFTPHVFAGLPAEIVETYQQISNTRTPIGVTDGNPTAATATFAGAAFRHFGLLGPIDGGLSADIGAAAASGGDLDSTVASLNLSLDMTISERIALSAILPLQYRETYGAQAWTGAMEVGLPISLLSDESELDWTLTPWGTMGFGAAEDLAQGALLWGGGITSGLQIPLGSAKLTLANQIAYFGGEPAGYGEAFDFEQNVKQFVLSNGIRVAQPLTDWLDVYASIAYVQFLRNAYVDGYWQPEVGLECGGEKFSFSIAATGEYGNDFNSTGGRVGLHFAW